MTQALRKFIADGKIFTAPGRAIDLSDYDEVVITRCMFTGTGGIFIQAKNGSRITVAHNQFKNIRKTAGMEYAQAVQISGLDGDNLPTVPVVVDLKITGNTVENEPGKCDVEDVINLIAISGTKASPILVTGNAIHGAYPADLSDESLASYSGGGIICDRGTQWAMIRGNKVYDTTNYGIAIAGGCFNSVIGNTATALKAQNVGIYRANMYRPDPFTGNVVRGNAVKWMTPKGRNDYWLPKEGKA